MNLKRLTPLLPVAGLALLGLTFWGGMLTQKALSKTTTASSSNPNSTAFGNTGRTGEDTGNYAGRRGTFGTVASISGTTMTITTMQGGTTTVSLAGNPAITDSSGNTAAASDIAVGTTVAVTGTTGSDGTVTATRIRLDPSFGGGPAGNAPSGTTQTN